MADVVLKRCPGCSEPQHLTLVCVGENGYAGQCLARERVAALMGRLGEPDVVSPYVRTDAALAVIEAERCKRVAAFHERTVTALREELGKAVEREKAARVALDAAVGAMERVSEEGRWALTELELVQVEVERLRHVADLARRTRDVNAAALETAEAQLADALRSLHAHQRRVRELEAEADRPQAEGAFLQLALGDFMSKRPGWEFRTRELALHMRVSKARAHRALERLAEEGLVETELQRPDNKRGGVAKGFRVWRWVGAAEGQLRAVSGGEGY